MAERLEKTGRMLRAAMPVVKKGAKLTSKDVSTSGLSMAIAVLLTYGLHDLAHLPVPPEVTAAFVTIAAFVVARKMEY